jgi:hypothetical protein
MMSMMASSDDATPATRVPPAIESGIRRLTDALGSEARLLDELVNVMRRQREAVATDDLGAIDDSVFATHRILVTIGEARRRRRTLNHLLSDTEELALAEMDEALGPWMTPALREARDGLHSAALTLSKEVEVNRRVLSEALASGDGYMRTLYGSAEPAPAAYGRDAGPRDGERSGGLLLNRRA